MTLDRKGSRTMQTGLAPVHPKGRTIASPEAADLLMLVANSCEVSNPLQAIHCLTALLANTKLAQVQEARSRCLLGRLLLQHTTNSQAAQRELLAAQAIAKDLLGCVSLQCEIACQLARFYQSQGEVAYQVQLYDQALALCSVGTAASEGAILYRWTAVLYLLKAQALASNLDVTRAVAILQAGTHHCTQLYAQHAPLLADVAVQMQLFLMQLYLVADNAEGFLQADQEAQALMEQLPAAVEASAAPGSVYTIPSGCHTAMVLQLRLLQALNHASTGHVDVLIAGGASGGGASPQAAQTQTRGTLLDELHTLAAQAAANTDTGFTWLPQGVVQGLIQLLSATTSLYKTKLNGALQQADAGLAALAPLLADMNLSHARASERSLDPMTLLECAAPLALHLQLLATKASALLGAYDLLQAQAVLWDAVSLAARFPHRLRLMLFPLHALLAQYCYAVKDWEHTKHHLQAVRLNTPRDSKIHLLASGLLAITLLSEPGGDSQAAVQEAIEAVGSTQYTAYQDALQGPVENAHAVESVVAMLATSLIKVKLEQDADARLLLSRTLKAAHATLSHWMLVAQTMCLMMPLQARMDDLAGAHGLGKSASLLARQNPAIQAQVYKTWTWVCEEEHNSTEVSSKRAVAKENSRKVKGQIDVALQQPLHAQLSAWGLRRP